MLRPARRGCTGSRKPASSHAYELFDHIWLSPALADCQDGAWSVRRRTHGGQGSDHDPFEHEQAGWRCAAFRIL